MSELKRTCLYQTHLDAGGTMVDFGGWEMPVQYPSGIVNEHLYTRRHCSLFDVSHMGRLLISGPGRVGFLQHVLTSNVLALRQDEAQYCIIPDENGYAIDDAYLYRFEEISSPERFARWCEVFPKLRPILDLYFGATMNENETDEMIFLNLVQALETLHARFITNKVKEYFRRVDQLTENYPKKEAEKWHVFLVDQGQERNKNGIYLRSRLADLAFAEGDILNLTLGDEIDLEEFIQKVIFTRNYYTHYDDTKLERSFVLEDIPYVNRILTGLLQYHILKLLGFETTRLRKRMTGTVLAVNMDRMIHEGVHEN